VLDDLLVVREEFLRVAHDSLPPWPATHAGRAV